MNLTYAEAWYEAAKTKNLTEQSLDISNRQSQQNVASANTCFNGSNDKLIYSFIEVWFISGF